MSHPFGDLLTQHLHRKHGLSQSKLAWGIDQDPVVISAMCKGQRLTGPQARQRVLHIVGWLHEQGVLGLVAEADALLAAAGMASLQPAAPAEATLLQALAPGAPAPSIPRDTPPALPPTNLPLAVTSFVGRELELAALRERLAETPTGPRLLTLTGVGGIGKTRLALELAAALRPAFADGVWLVEFAPLADPALVRQAVADTLGVREQPGVPLLTTLIAALQPRRLLLLLDNCEHLVGAVAGLAAALLRACPQVQILATSREALAIAGETLYAVPALRVANPHAPPALERLTQSEAVRLFLDRARAVQPGWQVTHANAPALAHLCVHLDGIPLALELAAARVRTLTVEQIAARLDDRFSLLTGGSRTALPRQQTLRALIDWSYDLLPAAEQVLLRRLVVFAGGWTLEAAVAVCAGETTAQAAVLDQLEQLVNKSLVEAAVVGPGMRFRLLETIRQYAREKLDTAGEGPAVHARHLAHFLALAEQAAPQLMGPDQGAWFARLEEEHDNLRAALRWAQESGRPDPVPMQGLRLAGALFRFWEVRGHLREGWDQVTAFLARAPALTVARAQALGAAGRLAFWQGAYDSARACFTESLALSRDLAAPPITALALLGLGAVAIFQDDYPTARACFSESLALGRVLGNPWFIAASLNNLADVARYQGDFAAAETLYRESLALARAQGDRQIIGTMLANLGQVALAQGAYAAAMEYFAENLTLFRELGNRPGVVGALRNLGESARAQGDQAGAIGFLSESLAMCQELEHRSGLAAGLEAAARLILAYDESPAGAARAARVLGTVAALRADLAGSLDPPEGAAYAAVQAATRARLDAATWEAEQAAGRALPLAAALDLALLQ